jgi:hypothetical protein
MTFERNPGPPAEPAPTPAPQEILGAATPATGPTPVQLRLQILSTEHWSLLASRNLAWNESFTRAGMYLSTLSGSMVALGLIGGVDGFHDAFFIFALVILPVALFVGLGTMLRMGSANYHDAVTIVGMNRIRGAYLEIAPELAPYFVTGVHDDMAGAMITQAIPPGMPYLLHFVSATPFLVMILNAVVAGAIAALVVVRFVASDVGAGLAGGIVVGSIVLGVQLLVGALSIRNIRGTFRPLFATPPDERPGA